jgi:hypothetical protein
VGSRHFSEGAYDNIAKKLFQVTPASPRTPSFSCVTNNVVRTSMSTLIT